MKYKEAVEKSNVLELHDNKGRKPMSKKKELEFHYFKACDIAAEMVEEKARKILRHHPSLIKFVMGMGVWHFVTKNDNACVTDKELAYLRPLANFINEWDEYLKITGVLMQFTATGPLQAW